MFVVLLRFSANRDRAGQFMDSHKQWIQRGFEDDIFVLVGSLQRGLGGAVIAHNTSLAALRARVDEDPFVAEGIVSAEILEVAPTRLDDRLAFLGGR
jgi:uncharacterized protein YciI